MLAYVRLQYSTFNSEKLFILLLNLIIGLYSIPRTTTFQAYAVGNKRFTTAALAVTLLATFYIYSYIK